VGGPFFERSKMSEEKTCKQCEHYQFYDGPERTAGREESVMFCPKLKEQMHGNGYSENVTRCAWGIVRLAEII